MKVVGLRDFGSSLEQPTARSGAVLVRLCATETPEFRELCATRAIEVVDSLERQLHELAAVRLPAATAERRRQFVEDRLRADRSLWACLQWQRKAVRLLEPDEYLEVVTNRNRDKITLEEQRRLRLKRVGVVGLSVGGESAVAIAQEHLCGHLVVADFDALELSNLNRLQAGFPDLGENKAVLVAQRIARIDPFLEVTVVDQGVTESNAEAFLDGLDLLVEECDDLPMKLRLRQLARERGLDIVYAGDERGFLSIEPYATHPELEVFHGRIEDRPRARADFDSAREFWRALCEWLGGWDAISEQSRRSLEQVGSSLCGYPQLASEAHFAAGQVGHVVRRLLLGERLPPFLGHLALEELLPPALQTGD